MRAFTWIKPSFTPKAFHSFSTLILSYGTIPIPVSLNRYAIHSSKEATVLLNLFSIFIVFHRYKSEMTLKYLLIVAWFFSLSRLPLALDSSCETPLYRSQRYIEASSSINRSTPKWHFLKWNFFETPRLIKTSQNQYAYRTDTFPRFAFSQIYRPYQYRVILYIPDFFSSRFALLTRHELYETLLPVIQASRRTISSDLSGHC